MVGLVYPTFRLRGGDVTTSRPLPEDEHHDPGRKMNELRKSKNEVSTLTRVCVALQKLCVYFIYIFSHISGVLIFSSSNYATYNNQSMVPFICTFLLTNSCELWQVARLG